MKKEELIHEIRQYNVIHPEKTKDLFEKKVLKLKDPKLSYFFATEVLGADINQHEKIVLKAMKPKWLFYFAKKRRRS